MDIFDMADENSDSLKDRHESLRKNYEAQGNLDVLDGFTKLVTDKWTMSVNLRQSAINNLLESGKYKNVYELKKDEKERKEYLKSYYKPRVAFDRCFNNGEKFKYGALNIGGLGASIFGNYCVAFKQQSVEGYSSLAFIKKDSLVNYVDDNHIVDTQQLSQDIANRGCVHFLTALKHEGDIELTPDDEWSSMVCCHEVYTEAVTTDDVVNTHIDTIRMSKGDYDSYIRDMLYNALVSEPSDNFERGQLGDFGKMLRLLDEQGIDLDWRY